MVSKSLSSGVRPACRWPSAVPVVAVAALLLGLTGCRGMNSISRTFTAMEKMPPFAKEKFLSGIREAAKGASKPEVVIFRDETTGAEMTRTNLAG